jgi:hypothetical protein
MPDPIRIAQTAAVTMRGVGAVHLPPGEVPTPAAAGNTGPN